MSRLILVPQYPTKMRYQEWWWDQFPKQLSGWFDSVLVLGKSSLWKSRSAGKINWFAPIDLACWFELQQIDEYLRTVELFDDDILLLNDLSFPGFFANALYHKKVKSFAICHATSKNAYDYFAPVRKSKYPVEKATAKLFEQIFVGSQYHADKLGWDNITVLPLPNPPLNSYVHGSVEKKTDMIVVSRPTRQKRNKKFEKAIERALDIKIKYETFANWVSYYRALSEAKVLLITSSEETYGYQVVDAIMNDCIPIAPRKFSYPELLPSEYLYNDVNDAFLKVKRTLNGYTLPAILLCNSDSVNFYDHLAQCMIYG